MQLGRGRAQAPSFLGPLHPMKKEGGSKKTNSADLAKAVISPTSPSAPRSPQPPRTSPAAGRSRARRCPGDQSPKRVARQRSGPGSHWDPAMLFQLPGLGGTLGNLGAPSEVVPYHRKSVVKLLVSKKHAQNVERIPLFAVMLLRWS